MHASADADWVASHTAGAPTRLRDQVVSHFNAAPAGSLTSRLAHAGDAALRAATTAGRGRGTALDLLAADALITLALLATAQRDPAALTDTAVALRVQAGVHT